MLRLSLISAICLLVTGQARASWADGLFDEVSRDFGAVPRGPVLTHHFRLSNNTKDTVAISNVRVSCGRCSSARALQSVLAPGQETIVLVTMNTGVFLGDKEILVYVQFSQPRLEEVRLRVHAYSRDDLSYTPDTLSFGVVKKGKEATGNVNVTFYGMPATQITGIKCDSNYIQPALEEVRRDSGEVVYRIHAKLRGDTPAGKWFTDIWLKTNNSAMPKLRVPVTVEIESSLALSPSTVALGKVKAGAETERIVILRGVRPFRILNIAGADDQVRVREASNETKNVHVLTVTLFSSEPGELNRVIRIHTDLATGGDVEFNAQAQIVP